jgi:hypothetical protein
MKKLHYFLGAIVLLLSTNSLAQSKFNTYIDYHYQIGFSEKGDAWDLTRKDINMYGNSLHISEMYSLNNKTELGVGIGADRYENPGYNTFPIFASVHYSPFKSIPKLYTYTDLGYSFKSTNANSGILCNLGFGYKKMLKEHFGFNFQAGYNLKQFKTNYYSFDMNSNQYYDNATTQTRHSISLGFGVIF